MLEDGLDFCDAAVKEGRAREAAEARVFCVRGCDHALREPLVVAGSEVVDRLLKLGTSVVDLWPGFWACE